MSSQIDLDNLPLDVDELQTMIHTLHRRLMEQPMPVLPATSSPLSLPSSSSSSSSHPTPESHPTPTALVSLTIADYAAVWEGLDDAVALRELEKARHALLRAASSSRPLAVAWHNGKGMFAFPAPLDGVGFALRVHNALLKLDWALPLLDLPVAAEERSLTGSPLFRGLRAQVGVHWGYAWGRDEAFVGALSAAAAPGQTLVSHEMWKLVDSKLYSLPEKASGTLLGLCPLPGWERGFKLYSLSSAALIERAFPKITEITPVSASASAIASAILRQIIMLVDHVKTLGASGKQAVGTLEKTQSRVKVLKTALERLGLESHGRKQAQMVRNVLSKVSSLVARQEVVISRVFSFVEEAEDFRSRVGNIESQFWLDLQQALGGGLGSGGGSGGLDLPRRDSLVIGGGGDDDSVWESGNMSLLDFTSVVGSPRGVGSSMLDSPRGEMSKLKSPPPLIKIQDLLPLEENDGDGSSGGGSGGGGGGGGDGGEGGTSKSKSKSKSKNKGKTWDETTGEIRRKVGALNSVYSKYIRRAEEHSRRDRKAIRTMRKKLSSVRQENEHLKFRLEHGMGNGGDKTQLNALSALFFADTNALGDSVPSLNLSSSSNKLGGALEEVALDPDFKKALKKRIKSLSKRASRRWSRPGLRQLAQSRRIGKNGPDALRKSSDRSKTVDLNLSSPETLLNTSRSSGAASNRFRQSPLSKYSSSRAEHRGRRQRRRRASFSTSSSSSGIAPHAPSSSSSKRGSQARGSGGSTRPRSTSFGVGGHRLEDEDEDSYEGASSYSYSSRRTYGSSSSSDSGSVGSGYGYDGYDGYGSGSDRHEFDSDDFDLGSSGGVGVGMGVGGGEGMGVGGGGGGSLSSLSSDSIDIE